VDILDGEVDVRLWIHGANLEKQSEQWRHYLEGLLAVERSNVTFGGAYDRGALGSLMAAIDWVVVPSIWNETGPIVVLEAFRQGRPVICSDIGGMSEKVEDGLNGLHFRRGDEAHLAKVMERAVETPSLWDELRAGIPEPNGSSLESNVETLIQMYNRLLEDRSSRPPSPQGSAQPIHR
jgi:glycosyltransferase involved in cell wall biosynthesis